MTNMKFLLFKKGRLKLKKSKIEKIVYVIFAIFCIGAIAYGIYYNILDIKVKSKIIEKLNTQEVISQE